jgi:hypothetical protein
MAKNGITADTEVIFMGTLTIGLQPLLFGFSKFTVMKI